MGQLKHFLGGLTCAYLGRKPRRARLGAQPLTGRAEERRRKHLERCTECRARLQRERQYLERLRGAAVPVASEDLTARLLARTGDLAAGQEGAEPETASPYERTSVSPLQTLPARKRPLRLAVQIAGGMTAAAALMGGAAYLLGSETALPADEAFTSALPGSGSTGPALSSESVSGAAWKLSGEPDVAPAGSLNSEQLSALRAQGWTCPELREVGYHLVWARGGIAGGSEVLELRLTDGQHFATVLEQHADGNADGHGTAAAGTPAAGAPVNVLTGHPATADGFVAIRLDAVRPQDGPAAPAGTLWVNKQAPFRAIYRTPTTTFTYISELPAGQADDGVAVLVHSRPGTVPAARGAEEVPARLERGLERIVELLAR